MRCKGGSGSWREKNGRLQYRLRIGGVVHTKTVDTHKAGEAWIKQKRVEKVMVDAGHVVPKAGTRMTVTYGHVAPEYLKHLAEVGSMHSRRTLTPAALKFARQATSSVLAEGWARTVVAQTTEAHIAAYVGRLRNRGLSTSAIRGRLGRLSQMMRYAQKQGWISAIPCEVELPRVVQVTLPPAMTEAEVEACLVRAREKARAGDDRPLLVVLLAADAGLRRAEIARLRGQDVELASTTRPAGVEHWGWLTVAVRSEAERTKSGRERRVPILTQRLADALWAQGVRFSSTEPVAGMRTGEGTKGQAKRVGAHLHQLRRRFASRCVEQGVDIETLRQWMGHADLTTTQRYLRVSPEPKVRVKLEG